MYRELPPRARLQTFGDFPVRDWFWDAHPRLSRRPAHFVATMGIGFEGGNLDHAQRYAERFREFEDTEAAAVQELVCAEEVAHVRFALRWFRHFTGGLRFDQWVESLPPLLSPELLRGVPMNRRDRERAGFSAEFLDRLAACSSSDPRPNRGRAPP